MHHVDRMQYTSYLIFCFIMSLWRVSRRSVVTSGSPEISWQRVWDSERWKSRSM